MVKGYDMSVCNCYTFTSCCIVAFVCLSVFPFLFLSNDLISDSLFQLELVTRTVKSDFDQIKNRPLCCMQKLYVLQVQVNLIFNLLITKDEIEKNIGPCHTLFSPGFFSSSRFIRKSKFEY